MSQRRSLVTEFVVIVLGVLVALAADAALERARERESAHEALEAVLRDLVADSISIADHLVRIDGRVSARARLGHFLSAEAEVQDSLAFLSDIQRATLYITFDANTAAFRDLTGSGRLRLVDDPALRNQLLTYYNWVENGAALDETFRATVLDAATRFLPRVVGSLVWDPAALENDEARIRSAAATAFDAGEIHRSGALREWLITTSVPFVGQSLTYGNIAEKGTVLIQLLRGALSDAE
jgi:hypothetical protein